MQKDNAIGIALLAIGRCDEEADIQPEYAENHRDTHKPGNQFSRKWEKRLWRRVLEPVETVRSAQTGRRVVGG